MWAVELTRLGRNNSAENSRRLPRRFIQSLEITLCAAHRAPILRLLCDDKMVAKAIKKPEQLKRWNIQEV